MEAAIKQDDRVICIYHNKDLDGFSSGAIVKKKYPNAMMIGYDYSEIFPWDLIPMNQPIIMVDVSLPMSEMSKLSFHSAGQFTWIDHHISAINDFNNYPADLALQKITAVLENGFAACEGTWRYLFPDKPIPLGILLLGEYDTWRNGDKQRWEREILPFQFGMRIRCNSADNFPDACFWDNTFVPIVIGEGRTVLQYQTQVNELLCKKASFEAEIDGLRAICVNGGGFNSDVFKSVYDPAKHDVMMPFQFNGRNWTISLYTTHDHIDCSAIAKTKGGGGHKKAAGFQVEDITKIFPNINA